MTRAVDAVDARLLNVLQEGVPLVERPFAAIGERLGVPEADVIARVAELKKPGAAVIRQIGGIFDSGSLGYRSCLVAAMVPEERVADAVRVLNGHPGVSHNYRRSHAYNVWYTVAVPPLSRLGLEGTVDLLHRQSCATATRMLPTLKLYKIGVKFDLTEERDALSRSADGEAKGARTSPPAKFVATDEDRRIIRVLQQDLPVVDRPFDGWAEQAGLPVARLLQAARGYLAGGQLRRFAAVLRHRQAGFSANAMGVWPVPAGEQDRFGATAATFAAVSHCYLRPTYEDWPYSIFTMVHAPTPAECEAVLAAISDATGVKGYGALYSTEEFKKVRVRYFTGEVEAWESQAAGG